MAASDGGNGRDRGVNREGAARAERAESQKREGPELSRPGPFANHFAG
jgi:hypothetical protein